MLFVQYPTCRIPPGSIIPLMPLVPTYGEPLTEPPSVARVMAGLKVLVEVSNG